MNREWSKAETADILNAVTCCNSVEQLIKVVNNKIPLEDLHERTAVLNYIAKNFDAKDFKALEKMDSYKDSVSDE